MHDQLRVVATSTLIHGCDPSWADWLPQVRLHLLEPRLTWSARWASSVWCRKDSTGSDNAGCSVRVLHVRVDRCGRTRNDNSQLQQSTKYFKVCCVPEKRPQKHLSLCFLQIGSIDSSQGPGLTVSLSPRDLWEKGPVLWHQYSCTNYVGGILECSVLAGVNGCIF